MAPKAVVEELSMSRRSSGANKGRKSRPNTPPGKVQAAYKQRVEQLLQQGRLEQAEQIIAALLEQRPEEGDALLLAGKIALQKGEYIRALQFFDRVMQGDTTSHEARYLSSYALYNLGQFEPALAHINSAISLAQPDRADYLFQKGTILMALWRYSEAEPIFTQLLEAYPRNVLYLNNAGNLYRDLGQFERAETIFRRAMAADPKNSFPYSNLLTTLHYDPHRERDEIHTVCLEWEKRYAANYSRLAVETDRTKERRLRIGLISDGFRNHPVGRMIIAALERLPREAYAFFAYSSTGSSDAITDRFKKIGHYEVTSHLSDAQLAEKIRTDRIDILFDLSGHNSGMRMPVMAMKPAPLQVKWVGGLINTTGLSTIDYLISDAIETPLEEEPFYSEKLIRMPGDYVCYELPDYTPPVNSLPAQTNGYITLGCFNNPAKINAVVLEQWAMIMHQLANSRLYLKGHQFKGEDLRENIYRQLEAHGIERARVTIEGPSSHKELLACYNRVDIALDPWPYSGGLTTCEAFVMGVPVVTLPGPTFAGRHSATHLVNAGMPELVTHSWEEYRARVIELASDLDSLAIIRSHLRTILLQSPVCDAATFATHLNNALRAIWQRYCEGKQPEALSFTEQGEVLFADATEPMPLHHPQPPQPQEDEQFTWEFEGRVIAIDHGGQLMDVSVIKQMLDLGTLELITFDPASNYLKHPLRQHNSVHYYPNVALGDGQPATLYACQAPEQSGTLKPAPHEYMPEKLQQELTLLAELPIATVALDKASELPAVDWLVLDDLNDSLALLEQGSQTLRDTLLLHVVIAFQPTHARQPNLTEISHWAARHGFRFYCFHNNRHLTHVPQGIVGANQYANELASSTALFIPSHNRLTVMDDNRRRKLAFIADAVYGLEGLAYEVLGFNGKPNEDARYMDYKATRQILEKQPHRPQSGVGDTSRTGTVKSPTQPTEPIVKPQLTLPSAVASYLQKMYASANNILEYGSGGSTILASEMKKKRIFTVENDLEWAARMRRYIAQKPHPSPAIIHTVDTGPTGAWARPINDSAWRNFHAYPLSVWDRDDFVEPDVVLIDGRFRVACFVATFMRIKQQTTVLFDDYVDRDYYHVVERLAKPVKLIGRMAHFELTPTEIPRDQLTWMIASFNQVTYANNTRR
jgi:predicted O-linked N-acetylglucosamine transferase (SPINDLY family)